MVNILIAGYHGFGNCGDEAILRAMVTSFRRLGDDLSLTALSRDPEFTETQYGIQAVPRFNMKEALGAVRRCDVFVLGGGTLLQDGTSTRSLLYYLGLLRAACLFRKRVMLYANGIGPVSGRVNRMLMRSVLKKVHCITLREKLSYNDLQSIGVENEEVHVTADAAFQLEGIAPEEAEALLGAAGAAGAEKQRICVSVRKWSKARYGEDYYGRIAEACDCMAEKGCQIVFLPMQYPEDVGASRKIAERMKQPAVVLSERYSPEEILGIAGRCDVMLSMRLHALIFAAVQNVPMAGIIYDPKIDYYLKELDMPDCGDVRTERISSQRIVSVLEDICREPEQYRTRLKERADVMKALAKENDRMLNRQLAAVRKQKEEKGK